MTYKSMIFAAAAALTVAGAPALAQTQGSTPQNDPTQTGSMSTGSMQSGSMQSGSMSSGSMGNSSGMSGMTASQTRTMKKCQAMSSDMMAKNKSCQKLMKMHPEMMSSGGGM